MKSAIRFFLPLILAVVTCALPALVCTARGQQATTIVERARNASATTDRVAYYIDRDYQRMTVWSAKADSALLAVTESMYRDSVEAGYLHQDRIYQNSSAALPSQLARLAYFHTVDLFSDRILLPDYIVSGPLGAHGLQDYDFEVVGSDNDKQGSAYYIHFSHHGIIFPGFDGLLTIDKETYQLRSATFRANTAINLGVLRDFSWNQTYQQVQSMTVLKRSDLTVLARTQLGLLPRYRILITNTLTDFSLVTKSNVAVNGPTVALRVDSAEFPAFRPFPLTMEQQTSLGSEHGDVARLWSLGTITGVILDPDVLQYNRVEGLRTQLRAKTATVGSLPLSLDAMGAYGFGDKKFKYDIDVIEGLFWHSTQSVTTSIASNGEFRTYVKTVPLAWLSVGARLHDDRALRGTSRSRLTNTLAAVGYKSDFPDYYWSHGLTLSAYYVANNDVSFRVDYLAERQSSIDSTPVTEFSILSPHKQFRINPQINDGFLGELKGTMDLNTLPEGFGQGKQFYSRLEVANASKRYSSDFEYSMVTVNVAFDLPVQQWGMSTVYFSAGSKLTGSVGNQQLYLFETPRGFSNRTRSFLTIHDREFQGDRIAMLFLEQNMFDLPIRALGLHFLEPFDLQWFAFSNIGYSSLSDSTRVKLREPIETTGNIPYVEAGLGVGNIFNLLRVDGAWRLTHHEAIGSGFSFIVTLGLTL